MGKKISTDQAAADLGISKRTLRRLISSGDLKAYKIGKGIVRIDTDDLADVFKPIQPDGKR